MKKLTNAVIAAIERGEAVVLCTILASSGSSPRGAGARMAVFADGSTLGTIGGGEVEYLATLEAQEVLKSGATRIRSFALAPEQVRSIGMICGGSVTVYYQHITQAEMPILLQMRSALTKDENSWLYLEIEKEAVQKFAVVTHAEACAQPELFASRAVLQMGEILRYAEPLMQAGRVYIFGGGHVGQALVPVLANIDFRVTLYDKRPEVAKPERFPMAEAVIHGDYSNIFDKITLKPDDYVVIMTPGHESDFALLEQVLRYNTRYVGCIGSRHKIARTQQLLREAGISEERIASVHSPIGLSIGAQTPAELAISIAAELIACRAQKQ